MKEILDHLTNHGLPDSVFYVAILAYAVLRAWQHFGKSASSDKIDQRFAYSENDRILKLLELDRLQRECDRSVVDVEEELKILGRLHGFRNQRSKRLVALGDKNGTAFLLGAVSVIVPVSVLVFLSSGVGAAFAVFMLGLLGMGIIFENFNLERVRDLNNPVLAFIIGLITGFLPYMLVSVVLFFF